MVAVLGKRKRTAADAWIEALDPLNGLSIAQARNVYNAARRHGSPLLQKMYDEIEAGDPVLMTCVDRRQSALAGLGWRTVANASARDPALAEEQRAALEEFANGIEDLDEAIEHLGLGFFRGFSVCQPVWEGNAVRHIELLDGWNFLRGDDGALLWNPECSMDPAKCEEITPAARLVAFRRRRAIDWPALTIYIRMHIGERDWGRFLERYGIPPVNAIMAPGSNKETRADYVECVEASHDGRSTAWPSGSQISYAEGARGQDPFTRFVEHQEKLVVLMATGGTLTSLAQADTGSLAGGAQMDVWTQIVARDGVSISAVLNRTLFGPFLREAFPGRPVAARLELGHEDEPTAAEAAEMAGKLRTAGYRVDQSQLEEATGYKLEREESAPGTGGMGPGGVWNAERPRQGVAEPLQNSRTGAGATTVPPGEKPPSAGILEPSVPDAAATGLARAMQRDLRPAARIIAEALRTHDWKAARKQLADALKECGTESAEALEREMRAAGKKAWKRAGDETTRGREDEGVANSERVPAGHGNGGQFTGETNPPDGKTADGQGGYTKEHREKVGQRGDWQSLGLPPGRDIPGDPVTPKTKIQEAKSRLEKGESVRTPLGDELRFDGETCKHIYQKGNSQKKIEEKLQGLDAARKAMEAPHEVWADEPKGRKIYVRFEGEMAKGGQVVNAVDIVGNHVYSWHTNAVSYDHYRKGRLLYVRG